MRLKLLYRQEYFLLSKTLNRPQIILCTYSGMLNGIQPFLCIIYCLIYIQSVLWNS